FLECAQCALKGNSSWRALKGLLPLQAVRLRYGPAGETAIERINSTDQRRLFFARALEAQIRQQLHITIRHICQCLCRRAGVRSGHVCYAIMRDPFLDINWIEVR